jgi:hypothetical protein
MLQPAETRNRYTMYILCILCIYFVYTVYNTEILEFHFNMISYELLYFKIKK